MTDDVGNIAMNVITLAPLYSSPGGVITHVISVLLRY